MSLFITRHPDPRCSGQAAALAGGTTMHIDFALPVNGSLSVGLTEWRRKAAIAVMDYGFHMAITSWDDQVGKESAGKNIPLARHQRPVGRLAGALVFRLDQQP